MPGLLSIQEVLMANHPSATAGANHSEHIPLWLSSSLDHERRQTVCVVNLVEIEEKLWTAQCYDLLEKIWHVLHVKSCMVLFKNKNIRGQVAGTRSCTVINCVQDRAKYLAQHYRIACTAMFSLSGVGDWEHCLHELKNGDVRLYQDSNQLKMCKGRKGTLEDNQLVTEVEACDEQDVGVDLIADTWSRRDGTGKTCRTLSWIWLVERRDGAYEGEGSSSNNDILRAEWAKSRACTMRATEEVQMLQEEMRHLVKFLNWKAQWWTERQNLCLVKSPALQEGIFSYAIKQARVQCELCSLAQGLFKTPLENMATLDSGGSDNGEEEGFEGGDNDNDNDD